MSGEIPRRQLCQCSPLDLRQLTGLYPGNPFDSIEVAVGTDEVCQTIIQHGRRMDGIAAFDAGPVPGNQIEGKLHVRQGERQH
ncbi:MAG TPA: hypothetical protein VGC81_03445, partial [Candidatus Methylomirabilis sp.]